MIINNYNEFFYYLKYRCPVLKTARASEVLRKSVPAYISMYTVTLK